MRRFHFRLQPLLNMRANTRKQVEIRLGAATAECNRLEHSIRDLRDRRQAVQQRGISAHGNTVLMDITYRWGYVAWLDQEINRLQQEWTVAEQKRLQVVDEYAEALREEKVLQNLRERRQAEYYRVAQRQEEKAVEDTVTDRYIRERGIDGSSTR